ncbi:MAG: O-antigen ligase family protein [Xanthobacteraceae bacterium]
MTPAFLAPVAAFVRKYQLLPYAFLALVALIFSSTNTQVYRNFFYIAVLPCFLLALDRRILVAIFESWVWRFAALLLLYMWLTLFWSDTASADDIVQFGRRAVSILLYLTILAMLAVTPGFTQWLFRWVVAIAAIMAVQALIARTMAWGWNPRIRLGVRGFSDYQATGAVYGMLLIGALFYLNKAKTTLTEWRLFMIAMTLMALFVLATQSRANWIVLAAVVILVAVFTHVRWVLIAIPVGIAVVLAFVAIGIWNTHLLTMPDNAYRLESWAYYLENWRRAPWFGVGADADMVFPASDGVTIWRGHNVYLSYLAHGGIVGLVLFLFMLGAAARAAYRAFVTSGNFALIGMLLYIMLFFLVDLEIFTLNAGWQWLLLWLPIGLIIGEEVRPSTQ